MIARLDVSLTPIEFTALESGDLSGATCIVLDILRATTSITVAIANGARSVRPVPDIAAALAERKRDPDCLLAGEREGERISAELAGGVEFDLGNSPREFVPRVVDGRNIVITTTNGSRGLHACRGAGALFAGSLPNRDAVLKRVSNAEVGCLRIVCSGTGDAFSFEDGLGAGAYVDWIVERGLADSVSDAAWNVRELFRRHSGDLMRAMNFAANGRRLLAHPTLSEDVACCLRMDESGAVPVWRDGALVG